MKVDFCGERREPKYADSMDDELYDRGMCNAFCGVYGCTRPKGHVPSEHEAGGLRGVYARWED